MARSVDDVDLVSVVIDVGALGKNGDTFFSFKLVGIHGALLTEVNTAVTEHGIDKGGLAMIDVSNNGDVSDFFEELFLRFGKLGNFGERGEGFSEKIRGEWGAFFGEGVEEIS